MNKHRLRAPSADGALLAEPPLSEAGRVLIENALRLKAWNHDFQGRSAEFLRPSIRSEAIEKARIYLGDAGIALPNESHLGDKLVITGHQPELFHPGVWIKNFAAAAIAKRQNARSLNLIVDNDIPKSSSLRVPVRENGVLKASYVDFDDWAGEIPYEDMFVRDEAIFESFAARVRPSIESFVADPILNTFWPRAVAAKGLTDRIGLRFALARRQVEESLGVRNLELPISQLCETEGFLWFATHLLANLGRFQAVHNEALREYRDLHKIRSRHHPVPALGSEGDWLEAPFWIWRATEPRRRPLMVRQDRKRMEIRIGGETEPLMEFPLGPDRDGCCAVERLRELPSKGIRLRTRALTTTMFSRYLLGDLFLHGIGGAKYDELGDEVSARFFGFRPPTFLTLSLTLRLGLGEVATSPTEFDAAGRLVRDLQYNPDRHLDGVDLDAETLSWIETKRAAIEGPVETHGQRVERFRMIRRCNVALASLTEIKLARAREERSKIAFGLKQNTLARSREFSFVLHSGSRLTKAVEGALSGLDEAIS